MQVFLELQLRRIEKLQKWTDAGQNLSISPESGRLYPHCCLYKSKTKFTRSLLTKDGSLRRQTDFNIVMGAKRFFEGILNKLTPDKFDKLCYELLSVGIETKYILKGVILLVFEKALDEPKYSSMYAQLCLRLSEEAPNFDDPGKAGNSTFRRLLLKQCEEEFNNRSKASQAFDKKDGPFTPEEEEQRSNTKRKILGNIRFIGELAKFDMLHEAIVHKCIKQLLDKKKRATVADMSESMECLCYLMRTIGPKLDTPKAKALMDQYFERIQQLLSRSDFPARIRFMIEDVIELRNAKWVPRKSAHEARPKMIQQIHQEAWKQDHTYLGRPGYSVARNSPPLPHGGWMHRPTRVGRGRFNDPPQSRGMNDVFVTDNCLSSRGPRYDDFGPGGMSSDRSGFGMRYGMEDYNEFTPRDPWADLSTTYHMPSSFNSTSKGTGNIGGISGWRPPARPTYSADGEISLRPAKDSIAAAQRPNAKTAQSKSSLDPLNRTAAPPIVEKTKRQTKQQAPTEADLKKQMESIVGEFMDSKDTVSTVTAIKELKGPKNMTSFVSQLLMAGLKKQPEDCDCINQLVLALHTGQLLTVDAFTKGVSSVLEQHSEQEGNTLNIKKLMAQFVAKAVAEGMCSVADVNSLTANGNYHPMMFLCLKDLESLKGQEWLAREFAELKLDLLTFLPEVERTSEKLISLLEEQQLVFLFPLLHIQADLYTKIEEDLSVSAIYKWVKDNVDPSLHTSPEFISVLTTCLLKYATTDSTLADSVDPLQPPEKDLVEKEKAMLKKLLPLLEKFVHEKVKLQVSVLYALQVFCHSKSFPKGMLLRMFVLLYDTEVVEEEAFLKWKEDVSEKHPGKGKALFQVNSWLTWLETADEEGSDSEPDE